MDSVTLWVVAAVIGWQGQPGVHRDEVGLLARLQGTGEGIDAERPGAVDGRPAAGGPGHRRRGADRRLQYAMVRAAAVVSGSCNREFR